MSNPLASRFVVSLFALASLVGATGRGEIIASNVSQAIGGTSSFSTVMTGQAQAFQTTLSNTVTSVSIDAEFGATDTFLGIYNDNAGEPWTFVGLVVSGTLLPPGVHTFPTMISLLPSTTYWLILSGTSGGWVYNSGTTGSGAGYLSTNALNSSGS